MGEAHAGDWIFRGLLVAFTVIAALARPSTAVWVVPLMLVCLWMNFMWPRRTRNTLIGSFVLVMAVVLLGAEAGGL